MAQITTYPLNGITYDAADAAAYFSGRTSGVYSTEEDFTVTPAGGMKLTVSAGRGWVHPTRWTGCSITMKENATLTIAEADSKLSRIDRIVLRYSPTSRKTTLTVLEGEEATSPTAPVITRSASTYDLCIAEITVKAATSSLAAANIADTRADEDLCGLVADGVTRIPTETLQKEARAKVASLEESATASAAAAAKSATAAETSNQAAQDAAENASTSETNAKASQTAAASSASTASSKASAASTSATKAANSATAAASSATSAANSATEAAASAKEAAAYTIDFTGATSSTAGVHGLVPAPSAGAQESYLRGDGTWAEVQEYTLPEATSSTLGGVKVGSNITVSGGTISVTKANVVSALGFEPSEGTTFETISFPTQSGGLTYTGSAQSPTWSGYDSSKMAIVDGTTSATNAGTYYVQFVPKVGYCWSDGTMLTKTASWIIGVSGSLTVPSLSGTLTYNTAAQSPTWSGYDSSKLTIGGTTSSTNAGTYTATFTPKTNYAWYDGTTSAKSVTWTIGKAAGKVVYETSYSGVDYWFRVTSYGNGTMKITQSGSHIYISNWDGRTLNKDGTTVYTFNPSKWSGSAGEYTFYFSNSGDAGDWAISTLSIVVEESDNCTAASTTGTLQYDDT